MKEDSKIGVGKINGKYVILDTAQIMESYTETMSVISSSNIIFSATDMDENSIKANTYLTDPRRKYFPYSDMPIHYRKRFLKEKQLFINLLLKLNEPYLVIKSGIPLLYYVTLVNGEFLLIKKLLEQTNYQKSYVSSKEVDSIIKNLMIHQSDEQIFIVDEYGRILDCNKTKEEENKSNLEFIEYLEQINVDYSFKDGVFTHPTFIQKGKIPNYLVANGAYTYFIKTNGKDFLVKLFKEKYLDKDASIVEISDIKLDTLDSILETIPETSDYLNEPVIKKSLNRKLFK